MRYEIVEHHDAGMFQKQVNDRLAQGWELQGGVSIAARVEHENSNYISSWLVFAQAMVIDQ